MQPEAILKDGHPHVLVPVGSSVDAAEKEILLATLKFYPSKQMTAAVLGISLKTLYNRLREYARPAF